MPLHMFVLAALLDRDGARLRGRGQRQLDGQDPVLVRRLGGVGVDVGAERDHAPERAVLDLELLVDALLAASPGSLGRQEIARRLAPRMKSPCP